MSKLNWITKPQRFPPVCQRSNSLLTGFLRPKYLSTFWVFSVLCFSGSHSPPLFQWIPTAFSLRFKFTALVNPGSFTAFSGFSPGILYPPHTLPSGRTALILLGHMVLCLVGSFIYSSFRSFHRPSHKVSMNTMLSGGDAIGGLKVPALKGLGKWRKWTSIEESHRKCKITALL